MLVELAIGDAYGAGFEYASAAFVQTHNTLTAYASHPRHAIAPGAYTDDTQMTIAVVEAMLSPAPWTPQLLAHHFVAAFKRDPREGYASNFYSFLQEINDDEEFLARIRPHSDKSGAAMRAGPLGLYPTITDVIERATRQAIITHDTTGGRASAVAAALMTHYFVYQLGPKTELGTFLQSHVPGPWAQAWQGKVGSPGLESVHAAVTAVIAHDALSAILRTCIAFTGDVDTVATVALCAASCSAEVAQDLPPVLYDQLEDGRFGRRYLVELEHRLMEKFNKFQA